MQNYIKKMQFMVILKNLLFEVSKNGIKLIKFAIFSLKLNKLIKSQIS